MLNKSSKSFALIVPTFNPGVRWLEWLQAYKQQSIKPRQAIVIDSNSTDGCVEAARRCGFIDMIIDKNEFDHGTTRQMALAKVVADTEIVVLLTQDAILADAQSFKKLLAVFGDSRVAAAYGRQLPHADANPIAAHARLYNYGEQSRIKRLSDCDELGIKTCFFSNSFAAYRTQDLVQIGGFFGNQIIGEDMLAAGELLLAGKDIAYVAEACVYHSHEHTLGEEFRRYFDIGVMHAKQYWLLHTFGSPTGEGWRFASSEAKYLLREAPSLLPSAVARTLAKYFGYRLGRSHEKLPMFLRCVLSMNRNYWRRGRNK